MGFGGSKAKVYDEEKPTTRFADIAGYQGSKREVAEVVDFLSHPERYARAGAVGPRGVLMVGPPGTGKTLMARAVAGEAGVPFLALTGSASSNCSSEWERHACRDLFADARKRAPSIIFIDEIDAIGQRRGGSPSAPTTSANRPSTNSWPRWTASIHHRRRGHGGHQSSRGPRSCVAPSGSLRPGSGDPPTQSSRTFRHPGRARQGQAPRSRRRFRRGGGPRRDSQEQIWRI